MIELGNPDFWKRLGDDPKALAAEVCSIDVVNLDQTMQYHPALRAWVNAAHEVARIKEGDAEYQVTKARARALLGAKEVLDTRTQKAKTVEVLKAEVEIDKDVMDAEALYRTAQYERAALRAMSDALEDRLQMIIQISAKQREELRDSHR